MTSSPSALAVEDAYFASNPPPKALPEHTALASAFIASHAELPHRRVVLITSGGTTVPLEKQTVRFIDNFSAGTRGATSAEYFLEAGYAVIFLHRQFSLRPYSRHFSHSRDCFLDFLTEAQGPGGTWQVQWREDGAGAGAGTGERDDDDDDDATTTASPKAVQVRDVLRKYRRAKDANMLLMIPFVTIGDYLHELRALSRLMSPLGRRGLLYLAAAVSDFFVPPERMAEHKIQSTDAAMTTTAVSAASSSAIAKAAAAAVAAVVGNGIPEEEEFDNFDASPRVVRSKRLVVDLDPVPKFLKNLVDGWAPQGMIVSYKLETDPAILVRKARYSLERYQHHLVIGNLLSTRKWEVVFVSPRREDKWLRVSPVRVCKTMGMAEAGTETSHWGPDAEGRPLRAEELPREDPDMEIENLIVPAVAKLHDEHIAGGESS
ncbi:hypothetical protein E4U31_006665 [Claviceps sp. LM219 group G6]|nr:hypothetical protein E4U31_006665 [Claviceps sp. LM219 group G6]KAG6117758.1 hypothetical protein E4U14_007538 [Claviceps sp. LM454 group G7]